MWFVRVEKGDDVGVAVGGGTPEGVVVDRGRVDASIIQQELDDLGVAVFRGKVDSAVSVSAWVGTPISEEERNNGGVSVCTG